MTLFSAVLAVAVALATQSTPQPPANQPPPVVAKEKIARDAKTLLEANDRIGLFNGVVFVARGDEILYQGAAGLANAEFDIRNTVETPLRIVAISQLFTAAAVMRLQEQGKLNVQDPIGKHVPSWPEGYHPITIHQLLTGQSGIKDVSQMSEFVKTVAVTRDTQELANFIVKEPLAAKPGTWSRQSNSNYHLLAALIERVVGLSFTEYIRREIIEPIGLKDTRHDNPAEIIPHRAAGYMQTPQGLRHAGWFHMNNAVGMANLVSTTRDVHTFLRALVSGRIVAKSSLEMMATEHVPVPSPVPGATAPGIGYGMNVTKLPRPSWNIGGTINGFMASFTYHPDSGDTIIVLSNVSNSAGNFNLVNAILASILGREPHVPKQYTAVTPRAEDLAAVAGTWEYPGAFTLAADGTRTPATLTFRVDGTRLFLRGSGSENELFASGPAEFFARHTDAQVLVDSTNKRVYYVVAGRKTELKRAQ